jgi:hypothetical protein
MSGKPDRKQLRMFGLSLGVVCLLWAGILAWRGKMSPVPWLLGAAPLLMLAAWRAPLLLLPIHRVWMPVAHAIARAMTWLLLTLVFFLAFTPYGLIMRALRKDPLQRKIERGRASYWILRRDGPPDPARLDKQY